MFKITKEWLKQHASKDGVGWTKKQLAVLGISWPPQSGWFWASQGAEITDEQKLEFEKASGRNAYEAKRKRWAFYDAKAQEEIYYTWPDGDGWRGSWDRPKWWDDHETR